MRSARLANGLAAAPAAFALGLLLVAAWAALRPGDVAHLEEVGCHRPEPGVASVRCAPPDAPLDLCDLTREPDRYEQKLVRVRARLAGYHAPALYGPACADPRRRALAEFDQLGSWLRFKEEFVKSGAARDGCCREAEVVVVGRFFTNDPRAGHVMEHFGTEEMRRLARSGEPVFALSVDELESVRFAGTRPPFEAR